MNDHERQALTIARILMDANQARHDALIAEHCGDDQALAARVRRLLQRLTEVIDDGDVPPEPARNDDADPLLGTRLGSFRVVARIGRGGMGVVYRGEREDADFRQEVALKLVRRGLDFDDVHARFRRERRILARLDHPNLARFIDGGVADDGRPWFALEFVHGQRISQWCDEHRLTIAQRVRLFLDVCAAVQYAHSQLVVHRDLKPENILVDVHGTVRLLDFGIAGLLQDDETAAMTLIGSGHAVTPEFAAPEQFAGTAAGVGTDIYGLGAVLYALIAGVPPIALDRGDIVLASQQIRQALPQSLTTAITRIVDDDNTTPADRLAQRRIHASGYRRLVRGDLSRILEKALAKEPERRYASATALADDLQRWLDGSPVRAAGNTLGYRLGKFVRRNPGMVAMGTLAGLALVVGIAGIAHQTRQVQRQAELAERQAMRAATTRDFLVSMMGQASPEKTGRRDVTLREFVDAAAVRVDEEFRSQPALAAELLALIGSIYNDLNEWKLARTTLARALRLADSHPEVAAEVRAGVRTQYAYALIDNDQSEQAIEHATAAVALLQGRPASVELHSAHRLLATAGFVLGRTDFALDHALTSHEIVRELHGANSLEFAASEVDLAYQLKDAEQAIATARHALDVYRAHAGARPDAGVTRALWALGNSLALADRQSESIPYLQEALPLVEAIYGQDSPKYARSLQLLAMAELGTGDLEAVLAHAGQARAIYQKNSPGHPLIPILDMYLGRALIRSGQPQAALDLLQEMRAKGIAREDVANNVAVAITRALADSGRPIHALAAIEDLLPYLLEKQSNEIGSALVQRARAQRLLGLHEAAGESLAQAEALITDRVQDHIEWLLENAQLAAATGDNARSREFAERGAQRLRGLGATRAPEYAQAMALIGTP